MHDQSLYEITAPPITRMRLAYMTVAMRDPNPVHMEDDFAARCGFPSVIGHGTFPIAYLGAAISRVVGIDRLKRLTVELRAPLLPGDSITTQVAVTRRQESSTGNLVSADLRALNQSGTAVATGTASWWETE